jgi:hypothetical protein
VIDVATRKVEVAGISRSPDGPWMDQMARNLLDSEDGFLLGKRYLILDRDPLYTKEFRSAMRRSGLSVIRLPPRSPNLNAFAERFVLSIRTECLNRIVPLGEAHLRRSISEYMRHYHAERNYQGIGNELIDCATSPANTNGAISRRRGLAVCSTSTRAPRECARLLFGTRRDRRVDGSCTDRCRSRSMIRTKYQTFCGHDR